MSGIPDGSLAMANFFFGSSATILCVSTKEPRVTASWVWDIFVCEIERCYFFFRYIALSWNSSYQVIRESLQEDTGSKIRRMFAQQTCAASLQHDIFELLELPAYQPILQRRRIHFWSCERSFSIDKTHFLRKRRCVFLTNISFRVILTNYRSM